MRKELLATIQLKDIGRCKYENRKKIIHLIFEEKYLIERYQERLRQVSETAKLELGILLDNGSGMLTRLDNLINNLPKLLEKNREENNELSEELEKMKVLVDEPFKHEEKLTFLQKRLYELDSKIEKASLEKTANKGKQALSSDNKSHKEQRTVNSSMSM